MTDNEWKAYRDCISDMLSITVHSHVAVTLRDYLEPIEDRFGDKFKPIYALNDLIKASQILISELNKKGITN